MTAEKLQKLWNLATRNPNENEALVAARKFIRAIKIYPCTYLKVPIILFFAFFSSL